MNNTYPQISIVFDRRKVASSSTKAPIEIRICHNYKQKYISTGIMLYKNQWKKGKIINCSDIMQISETLTSIVSNIRSSILDMIRDGNIDISQIPERLENIRSSGITFIEFCIQRANIRKYGKEQDTCKRYSRFIRLFSTWGKIKNFTDITEENIILYDKYLRNRGMKDYSKWNNYHRFLNSFILDAIDAGYLKKNPYRWVNIEKGKDTYGIDKCLTPEEFTRIRKVELPTDSLRRVRDVFVFQTYTCMSYSDLKSFDSSKLEETDGMKVYIGNRTKTQKTFVIPILPAALSILYKYNNVLPIISNVKYNEYLKLVAQAAGIDKPISSHWARHTGATLLLNEGIDMKIVSKICGHSSTRITEQVYAKLLDETVVKALRELQ